MNQEYMRQTNFLINKYINKVQELNNIIAYQTNVIKNYEDLTRDYNSKFEKMNEQHNDFLKKYNDLIKEYNKDVEEFEEKKNRYECLICCDKYRDCVIEPCYHFVSCINCTEKLVECPICRTEINSMLAVYGT
jgi:hypothetical protein